METEIVCGDVPDDGSLECCAGSKIGHEMNQPREVEHDHKKEVLGRRWKSICAHCEDSGLMVSGRTRCRKSVTGHLQVKN